MMTPVALAGCPVTGVSPSLRVDRATATGVIIRAGRTAPLAGAGPDQDPPRLGPAQLRAPAPDLPAAWLAFLAGAATVLATSILVGTRAALSRRRRAALPRAVRLVDRHIG